MEEEKARSEHMKALLLVRQSEVEELKEEVERKLKEHADYKKEMLMKINQTKEETEVVKEKQKQRDSERDAKRQVIVKYYKSIVI